MSAYLDSMSDDGGVKGELDLSSKQNISKLQVKAAKKLREHSTNRYTVNPADATFTKIDFETKITKLQDRAAEKLRENSTNRYAVNPDRDTQVMMLLPRLRLLRSAIVEEIFFSGLTGSIRIWNVILIVLQMDTLKTTAAAGKC
ncbi:hypothetical protein QYM36_016853 [Artemia franciscana]|uniref:Uncharacterized protein n=1 Tax=Artemia franciscana TaxID=6661 RepID=A0AA88KW89_ARTSF|nr:hypothetical protein QYM36_016853 [Artemia franciscana]